MTITEHSSIHAVLDGVNEVDPSELEVYARNGIKAAIVLCHGAALRGGWWTNLDTNEPLERNVAEMLCLVHSEVSEALEGYRKNLMDDKLPKRTMLEVELADTIIRIFDVAGGLKLDLSGALIEKLKYNAKRADHKPENRRLDNGKKI